MFSTKNMEQLLTMKFPFLLRFTVFFCLLSISFQSCKKDSVEEETPEEQANPLGLDQVDPEFETRMALAPDTFIPLSEIFMIPGISVQEYLDTQDPTFLSSMTTGRISSTQDELSEDEQYNRLLNRLAAVGNMLVTRSLHIKSAGSASNEPAQPNGLAYSFGGKNHAVRAFPTTGGCADSVKIFGLDCSGMVYQMSTQAGIPEVVSPGAFGVNNVMDTTKWNAAFRNSEYNKLFMKDMGELPLEARMPGDLVFYMKSSGDAFHIGWVLKNAGNGVNYVYQSNGGPDDCSLNLSANKGPSTKVVSYTHGAAKHKVFRLFKKSNIAYDIDGNAYTTIDIGNQTWMQEDLRTTHFNDGSPITNINDNTAWVLDQNGAMCNYNNTGNTSNLYGKLYNWYTVIDPGGLCPVDWHVATDDDWKSLEATLGMPLDEIDGIDFRGAGQEVGTQLMANYLWDDGGLTPTNNTGFTALPGGGRSGFDGVFGARETTGFWWTATEDPNQQDAWYRELFYNNSGINRNTYTKEHGFAVRCVKD